MKNLFFTLFCLLFSAFTQAQTNVIVPAQPLNFSQPGLTIDSIARYLQGTITAADTGEGSRASRINEFIRTWDMRVSGNDSSGANMFQQYLQSSQQAALARGTIGCNIGAFSGKWSSIGPDSLRTPYLGMLNDIWVDAVDTTYLLAAGYGGVWKSTDGGATWHVISDNTPVSKGIVSPKNISVNPTNNQHFYVSSGTYNNQTAYPQGIPNYNDIIADVYGNGLLVTTNGGATWQQEILPINNPLTWVDSVRASRAFFSPDGQRVYGMHHNKFFYKPVNGNWVDITPTLLQNGQYFYFLEMKFVPTGVGQYNPNHFYMAVLGSKQLLDCYYDPATQSHTFSLVALPTPISRRLDSVGNFYIAMPNAQTLYAIFNKNDTNGNNLYKADLFRYDVSLSQWTYVRTVPQAIGAGSIHASSARPGTLYYACVPEWNERSYMSTDSGRTFFPISEKNGIHTHCDVRGLYIQKADADPNGTLDRVYLATDGGIALKPRGVNPVINQSQSCKNINGEGLACGRFTSISSLEMDGSLVAAQMDNGSWSYRPHEAQQPWLFFSNGDGAESVGARTEKVAYSRCLSCRSSYLNNNNNIVIMNSFLKIASSPGGSLDSRGGSVSTNETEGHAQFIPLWPDQYGGFYIGQKRLWRKIPGQNATVQVSGTFANPTYDVHLPEYWDNIRAMSFSQYYDSLTGYVIHEDGTLFYRNDLTTPGQFAHQFNIRPTTGFPAGFQPTDIVCDPAHPERVWVSIKGLNDDNPVGFRVMYSPDAGFHWFDVSQGLPLKLPVVNIEYQESSPYIYAATDVGMYRLDMSGFNYTDINDVKSAYNSIQWTCFNQGAPGQHDYPMVNTPALNINYCSGTLNTAAYGRGIWSTPLWEQFNIPDLTENNVVTSNTTWNSTRYLTSGIRVKNGATLTISGGDTKIHLPKDGQIWVEPGSKLIVDKATLTNGCKDCMWGGIVAMGDASLPQTAANQATVIVQNNALIENARNAITTWGGDLSNAGAILNLSNSTFRNNRRSIEFISYHNQLAGRPVGNVSRIHRCTFELDDNYRGTAIGYWFSCFASLWDVEGVVFSANTFTNSNTREENWSNGIMSYNAGYQVVSSCNGNSYVYPCIDFTRNSFSGLRHGISAEGDNLTDNTIYVDQAAFNACGVGVYAGTVNHFEVARSTFNIGNAPFPYDGNVSNVSVPIGSPDCIKNIGVRARSGCSGFRVEDNSMSSARTALPFTAKPIGVSLENTGVDYKEVYRNTFKTLDYGVTAVGTNGQSRYFLNPPYYISGGALITCNTFNNNFEDISVFPNATIHPKQAAVMGGAAGNTFSGGTGWITNNNTNTSYGAPWYIEYLYDGRPASLPQALHVNLSGPYSAPECQSNFDDRTAPAEVVRDNGPIFRLKRKIFMDTLENWKRDIDGGSTAQLIDLIDKATTDDYGLYTRLMSYSPYVSDKALRYLGSTGKFAGDFYYNLLRENPEVLRAPGFMDFLANDLPTPFSEGILLELQNIAKAYFTDREARQRVLNDLYNEANRSADSWISALKTDTLSIDPDTLNEALSLHPALFAKYALAARYAVTGQVELRDTVMNAIAASAYFTDDTKLNHNLYGQLWSAIKNTDLSRRYPDQEFDGNVRAALEQIAAYGEEYSAAQQAAALLRKPPPPYQPDPEVDCVPNPAHNKPGRSNGSSSTSKVATNSQNSSTLSKTRSISALPNGNTVSENTAISYLRLSPNPANDYVTVDYAVESNSPLSLRLLSAQGSLLSSQMLSGNSGTLRLPVKDLSPGFYLLQINAAAKTLKSAKIQVQH